MDSLQRMKKIEQGIQKAVAVALARHKKLGQSIAIWQDNKVTVIPANKIKVPTALKQKTIKPIPAKQKTTKHK